MPSCKSGELTGDVKTQSRAATGTYGFKATRHVDAKDTSDAPQVAGQYNHSAGNAPHPKVRRHSTSSWNNEVQRSPQPFSALMEMLALIRAHSKAVEWGQESF